MGLFCCAYHFFIYICFHMNDFDWINDIEPKLTMGTIKVGDMVCINPTSKYYGSGKFNPINTVGVVTDVNDSFDNVHFYVDEDDLDLNISVNWGFCINTYRCDDLMYIYL